jgi:hypothetical protein
VAAVFQEGLARGVGLRQDWGVHVHDDLVALARRPRLQAMVQRRLGEQRQRVGLLLRPRRRVLADDVARLGVERFR